MKCLYINNKEFRFKDERDFKEFYDKQSSKLKEIILNSKNTIPSEAEDAFKISYKEFVNSKTVKTSVINNLFSENDSQQNNKNNTGKIIAIIGTAGRSKSPTIEEWNNMLKDAESRVTKNDTLISGGAAFADHIAVKLFLEGKVKGLKLRLSSSIENGKFVFPEPKWVNGKNTNQTAGSINQYYHDIFSKLLGVNTVAEIQQAIDKGAEVTYETETSNKAMFIRNEKVAKESNSMIAYTYGEGNLPDDGGTKDTWDKSKYSDKTHVSISKISNQSQQTSNQSEKIYNQLGNKTESGNVFIDEVNGKKSAFSLLTKEVNNLKKLESFDNGISSFEKYRPIVAYRTRNNNFLEALEKDNAIGNPWGPYGLYKTAEDGTAVKEFIAWMTGEKHTDKLQDYRQAIIYKINSGEFKNKQILYYKELNRPSHATALDYLINNPNSPFNQPQQTSKTRQIDLNNLSDEELDNLIEKYNVRDEEVEAVLETFTEDSFTKEEGNNLRKLSEYEVGRYVGRKAIIQVLNTKIESSKSQDERIQDLINSDLESLEPTVSSNVINSSTINPDVEEAFDRFVSKLNTQPNPLEYKIGDTYEVYSSTGSLDGINTIVGENGTKWLIKTRAGGSSNIEKKELIRKSKLTEGSTESRYKRVVNNSTILDSDTIEELRERIKGIEFNDSYGSYDDFLKNNDGFTDFDEVPFYKEGDSNKTVKGMFWNNTIYLFDKKSKELVVEHELVHSILKIASSKNDANYQRFQSEILGILSEFLKNKPEVTEISGFLKNVLNWTDKAKIDELVTRILTDKRFSDEFKSVKTTAVKKKTTFWQKVVDAFKTLLGVEDGTYFDKILEPVVLYIDSLDYDTKSNPVYLSEETIEEELEDRYEKFNSQGKQLYKDYQDRVLKKDFKVFDSHYFEKIEKFNPDGKISYEYQYNLANIEEGDLVLLPLMVKSNNKWLYATETGELTEKVEDNKNYKTKWFPVLYENSPYYPTLAIGTEKGGSKALKNKVLAIRKLDKNEFKGDSTNALLEIREFRKKSNLFNQALKNGTLKEAYKATDFNRVSLKTNREYTPENFEKGDIVTVNFPIWNKTKKVYENGEQSFYGYIQKQQGSGLLVTSYSEKDGKPKENTFFIKTRDVVAVHKSKEDLLEDIEKVKGWLSTNPEYTVSSVKGNMSEEEYIEFRRSKDPNFVFDKKQFDTYKLKGTNIEKLSKGDAILVQFEKGKYAWKSVLFSDGKTVIALDGKYPKQYKINNIEKIAYNNSDTSASFKLQNEILKEVESYKWYKDYYSISAKKDDDIRNLKTIKNLKEGDFITYKKEYSVGSVKKEATFTKMIHRVLENGVIEIPFQYKDKKGIVKYGVERVFVNQIQKFILDKKQHEEVKDDLARVLEMFDNRYFTKKIFRHKEAKSWDIGATKYFTVPATPELFLRETYKDSGNSKYTFNRSTNSIYEVTPEGEVLVNPVYEFGKDAPYIRMKKYGDITQIVNGKERSFNISYLKDKNKQLKPDSIDKINSLERGELVSYRYEKEGKIYYYDAPVYTVGIKNIQQGNNYIQTPYVQVIIKSGENLMLKDINVQDIVSIGKIFVPPVGGAPVNYTEDNEVFIDQENTNTPVLKHGLFVESKKNNIVFYTELVNELLDQNPDLNIEFENKEYFPTEDINYFIQDDKLIINSDAISTTNEIGSLAPIWLYKLSKEQPDVYSQLLETFETNPYVEYYKEKFSKDDSSQVINHEDKIIWGHPAIGKTTVLESNPDLFIDWDDEFNKKRDKWIEQKSNTIKPTPEFKQAKNEILINYKNYSDFIDFTTNEWNRVKEKANQEDKKLLASPSMLLDLFEQDFDKIINMSDETFIKRNLDRQANDETNSRSWKEGINNVMKNVKDKSKIITTDKYIGELLDNKKENNPLVYYISNKLSGRIENDFENKWAKENQEFFDLINSLSLEFTSNYLDKKYQTEYSEVKDSKQTLKEGLNWIKSVMPNANVELVEDLIDGIGKGSYNTVNDLITLSAKYADKKTAKHEVFHAAFNRLSKEKQEELLNEGSKLFGIPRGESSAKILYQLPILPEKLQIAIRQQKKYSQILDNFDKELSNMKMTKEKFNNNNDTIVTITINIDDDFTFQKDLFSKWDNINITKNDLKDEIKESIENKIKELRYNIDYINYALKNQEDDIVSKKQVRQIIKEVLIDTPFESYADLIVENEESYPLVANLVNMYAKTIDDSYYQYKPQILNYIANNDKRAWSKGDGILYVETPQGQVSFHVFEGEDKVSFARSITNESNKWSEIEVQFIADKLLNDYLASIGAIVYDNKIDKDYEYIQDYYDKFQEKSRKRFQSSKLKYTGDLAIEEKIAEMMENTPDEKLPKTLIGKWIQSVRNFFRNIFKEKSMIQQFLRNINQGNIDLNSQRLDYTLLQEGKTKFKNIIEEKLTTNVYKAKNPELLNSGLIDQVCNF